MFFKYKGDTCESLALRGFKIKIALNIALLLLLSALMTDILVYLIAQNWIVRREILQAKSKLEAIAHLFFEAKDVDPEIQDRKTENALVAMFQKSGFEAVFLTRGPAVFYLQNSSSFGHREALKLAAEESYRTHNFIQRKLSEEKTLLTGKPHDLLIAFPAGSNTHKSGAVSAALSLHPIYSSLKDLNNPILLYIALNTLVLTGVGLYRIFRIYLRPIDRIISQADQFREDGDLLFAFRREDNELNRLSSALNRMLKRISADRLKLKETVASLEKANDDLKKAQRDIVKAEKLASVGRLAAGIAHEIGNPIGIIIGYLELLGRQGLDEDQKLDFLTRTEAEVQRINRIIRQLLELARPRESRDGVVDVQHVIRETIEVMRVLPIMKGIEIRYEANARDHDILGNADQLRQVLINLMINSADAIRGVTGPCEGRILIATSSDSDPGDQLNQWLTIHCTDNGTGIPPEAMEYVFDPFYTSKEPGKGTGLGLAVSFMIVEKMGGSMTASNTAQGGTIMTIRLPMVNPLKADSMNCTPPSAAAGRRNDG